MKVIGIIGSGRSGTTLLTKSLKEVGVYVGNVNPLYENEEILRVINDKILKDHNKSSTDWPYGVPKAFKIPEDYYYKAMLAGQRFRNEGNNNQYGVLKDPRVTILNDIWKDQIDIYVGMFRSPYDVIQSYIYHGYITGDNKEEKMKQYWLYFNNCMIDILQNTHKPKFLLEFNNTISIQIENLQRDLGLPTHSSFEKDKKHFNNDEITFGMEDIELKEIYTRLKEIKTYEN